jgi:hypothetical protein
MGFQQRRSYCSLGLRLQIGDMKPRIEGPSSPSGKQGRRIEAPPRMVQVSRYCTGISNQAFSLKYLLPWLYNANSRWRWLTSTIKEVETGNLGAGIDAPSMNLMRVARLLQLTNNVSGLQLSTKFFISRQPFSLTVDYVLQARYSMYERVCFLCLFN